MEEDEIDREEEEDLEEEDDALNEDEFEERADGEDVRSDESGRGNAEKDGGPGCDLLRKMELEQEGGSEMVSDEFALPRRRMTKLLGMLTKRLDKVENKVQSSFKEVKNDNSELQALLLTLHTLVASKKSTSANQTECQRRLDCRTAILDCDVKDEFSQNVLEKNVARINGEAYVRQAVRGLPTHGCARDKGNVLCHQAQRSALEVSNRERYVTLRIAAVLCPNADENVAVQRDGGFQPHHLGIVRTAYRSTE